MKKIICITIIILFLTVSFSLTGCIEKNEVLDQFQDKSDMFLDIPIHGYFAQSFIPTLRKISRVEVKIYKEGIPGWINLSIRKYLDDSDLVSLSIHSDQIPNGVNWINFDIEDLRVTPYDVYYIILNSYWDINNKYFYMWYGTDNNLYGNGSHWRLNSSDVWLYFQSIDRCFKTYGYKGIKSSDYLGDRFIQFIENNPEFYPLLKKIIHLIE